MTKLKELQEWLAQFPDGSEIVDVSTSFWEDDARIMVKTLDGKYESKSILAGDRKLEPVT